MKRYFIEEAKCGVTKGGMACGPDLADVVAAVKFNTGADPQWISLVEVEGGIPCAYLSDKDIYEDLQKDVMEDEEFIEYLQGYSINDFNGITLNGDYFGTFMIIDEDPENPAVPLVRYLIALVRCGWEDLEELIGMAGQYADEMDIPMSDEEEDFRDEYEEYDEEDD